MTSEAQNCTTGPTRTPVAGLILVVANVEVASDRTGVRA